jgi:hypothetical protein
MRPEAKGAGPGAKPSFSTLPVARDDPAEQFLVRMLLGSEQDLAAFADPIAFPVFGRGRVLYALVGKGITEENVSEAVGFLVGPCSCQIKELNPGADLLITAAWEDGMTAGAGEPREPPPLARLGVPAADAESSAAGARPAAAAPDSRGGDSFSSKIVTGVLIGAGLLVCLMAIGTVRILRRR